ncbi:MAG: hypothetical protein GC150_15375 [Rhizobiales bacterium]|nr:hypothetical protein [Hyphomicrobiales bacterium]
MSTRVPAIAVPGVFLMPITIPGQRTTTTAGVSGHKFGFPVKVLGASVYARASGGTSPTLAVDILAGGTTLLTAPVAVTAAAATEASLVSGAKVTDEQLVTLDITITGTNPTWDDICVLLTVVRI